MRIAQEKLKEIVASHCVWIRNEAGGKRADFRYADLRFADFSGANLSDAILVGANFCNANFRGADLRHTDLCGADLRCADLRFADLCGANLSGANLSSTNLCDTYYQVVRIGSRNATTTYCVEKDNVVCGCWNNYRGGTLEEFKKRVESVYGENSKKPNKKYYTQYMAAIEFFEKMAKLTKMEEK